MGVTLVKKNDFNEIYFVPTIGFEQGLLWLSNGVLIGVTLFQQQDSSGIHFGLAVGFHFGTKTGL